MVKNILPNNPDLGSLLLRITLGILFVYAGFGKVVLGGAVGLSGLLWGQLWLAYLVGLLELVGGIFLLLGFMSRYAAIPIIVIMLFAIGLAHNPLVDPSQLQTAMIRLIIVGGLVQIMLSGPGKYSLLKD